MFPPLFLPRIFYLRGFSFEKAKNNRVKKSSFESRQSEKIDAESFSKTPLNIFSFLIFSLFHTQPDILRENPIFSSIQSVKVKTSFISGWEMRWVCKILHVNKLQRLTKVLDKSSIVCHVVYNDFEKEVRSLVFLWTSMQTLKNLARICGRMTGKMQGFLTFINIWIFTLKSHFWRNSHFQSLIFHKIHIFKVSF